MPTDLLAAGLPQTFNLYKRQHLGSTEEQSVIKRGVSTCVDVGICKYVVVYIHTSS